MVQVVLGPTPIIRATPIEVVWIRPNPGMSARVAALTSALGRVSPNARSVTARYSAIVVCGCSGALALELNAFGLLGLTEARRATM